LNRPERILWEWLVASVLVLSLFCGWIFFLSKSGGLGVGLALLQVVFASVAAVLAGLLLAIVLRRRRKSFASLIVLLFPLAIFFSMEVGRINSSESMTGEQAIVIARALNQYRADNGHYPEALDKLVPQYLTNLKEPSTLWGWLYTANEKDFSIGYVYDVDGWSGYYICFYTSSSSRWECDASPSGRPFNLPLATPGPYTLEPTIVH
jgi:hypothetical protein